MPCIGRGTLLVTVELECGAAVVKGFGKGKDRDKFERCMANRRCDAAGAEASATRESRVPALTSTASRGPEGSSAKPEEAGMDADLDAPKQIAQFCHSAHQSCIAKLIICNTQITWQE